VIVVADGKLIAMSRPRTGAAVIEELMASPRPAASGEF
jgi:hypothetical protein